MIKFKILLGFILIVVGGWTGGWFYAASILRQTINSQIAASEGAFSCAEDAIGGYPFRLFFDCKNASLVNDDFSYTLPRAKASVVVTQPKLLLGFMQSPLEITDAFSGAHYIIRWDEAKMSLRHDLVQLKDGRLEISNLVLNDTGGTGPDRFLSQTVRLFLQTRDTPAAAETENYALFVSADEFSMPGADISHGTAKIDLYASNLPPIDGRPLPIDFARIWQSKDGAIALNDLTVQIDDAKFSGTGNFALDGQGQLNGMSEVTLVNFNNYLAATPLGPMAGPLLGSGTGEGDTQQIVISVRNGLVLLGPLPLMQLSPLF